MPKQKPIKKGLFVRVNKEIPDIQPMICVFGMWVVYTLNRHLMILEGASIYTSTIVSMLIAIGLTWLASELSGKCLEGI